MWSKSESWCPTSKWIAEKVLFHSLELWNSLLSMSKKAKQRTEKEVLLKSDDLKEPGVECLLSELKTKLDCYTCSVVGLDKPLKTWRQNDTNVPMLCALFTPCTLLYIHATFRVLCFFSSNDYTCITKVVVDGYGFQRLETSWIRARKGWKFNKHELLSLAKKGFDVPCKKITWPPLTCATKCWTLVERHECASFHKRTPQDAKRPRTTLHKSSSV